MTSLGRARVDRGPVRLVSETVRISVWAVLGAWLARKLGRLLVALFRSPTALATLALSIGLVWVWRAFGLLPILVTVAVLAAALIGWRVRWPGSFHRRVRCTVRGWRRGGWVYQRRWATGMDTAGLAITRNATLYLPALVKVRSTLSVDRVRVRMLPGQTLDDFASVADRLAQTFGTLDCRVRSVPRRVHELELWLLISDPLAEVVPPFDPQPVNPTSGRFSFRLPVALAEDGTVWWLNLLGTHVLVVGVTGAGKGSVIWAILTGLDEAITAGLVHVWVIDPKGGMELALGERLFHRFCYGDSTRDQPSYELSFAVLLEDAVAVMRARQDRLRGITRLHEPSTSEPLIVLVVDEIAALTAWTIDREAKRRIAAALGLLLSQGRAVGICVIGAVQDPRKEVLTVRDLFPTRIALRLSEAEQVGLVLGPGARNRGAVCDRIPETLPGVGYVIVDGVAEPIRVRFCHITDEHIATLGREDTYPEPAQLVAVRDVEDVAA